MLSRTLGLLVLAAQASFAVAADGPSIEWQVFDSRSGLAKDGYYQVFEDLKGNVWLVVEGSATVFDGSKWTKFQEHGGFSKTLRQFFCDSYGNIWFVSENLRISKYDRQRFVEGGKLRPRFIFEDSKKNLWLASSYIMGKMAGLMVYRDPETFPDGYQMFTKKDGLAGKLANVIFEDSRNTIWVGSNEGISAYDGSRWTIYDKANGFTSKNVTSIVEDTNGNVWFGSEGGLFRYNGTSWQRFSRDEGTLPTNDVLLLEADGMGNVWVGLGGHSNWGGLISALSDLTHKSGVLRYDGTDWVAFRGEGDSPPVKVIKMKIDSKGNVWCDSYTSGIYLYDGTTWTKLSKENGFYANHFHDFEEDSHGNIWLATNNGLLFFDGQDWTQYTVGKGLFAENVFHVIEDSRGDIWITTEKGVGRSRPHGK